jgi:hypothetical protein
MRQRGHWISIDFVLEQLLGAGCIRQYIQSESDV